MKKTNIGTFICFGGILSAITVLFQSAPVFLPTIGLALSPFSTLPIAIAATSHISLGFAVLISSTLILIFVSVEEAIILLFTTGLLGLIIGILLSRKGILLSISFSSLALTIGLIVLTYFINFSSFVDFARLLSTPIILLIYFIFSFLYALLWNICLMKCMKRLKQINT